LVTDVLFKNSIARFSSRLFCRKLRTAVLTTSAHASPSV
jgi:hypothetical protein